MKAALMAKQFAVEGRLVTVEPHGTGNVNDTYIAIFRTTFSEQRFILQRIKKAVFPEPENIFHNMRVVTDHAHRKLEAEAEEADRIWQLPKIIPNKDGRDFAMDDGGDYWRAITHIAGATAHEQVQGPEHAREAGIVLGQFHRLISDVPADSLRVALGGFHITPGYLARMDSVLPTTTAKERLTSANARQALQFVEKRRDFCHVLENARQAGRLRQRPTHGDPKVGNIMVDNASGKGTCIVDLDTVQAGLIHYDIGDALRSACNPAGEDAKDLNQVVFDLDLFENLISGYLSQASSFLDDNDRAHLYDCIRLIALELGLRFFGDYLAGDTYFRVRYDTHNLHRARVQFKLVESVEARERAIRKVLESV